MIQNKVTNAYKRLDTRVREATKAYYHSRPLAVYTVDGKETVLDLRDCLLAAAVTGNNVLFSGASGEGKTHLAKMVMAGLFGSLYKILQMDASFSLDKLRDMAFNVVAGGGRLHDTVKETALLTAPGVIVDEYNRAPSEITNEIQGWLQNGVLTFEGGREIYPGIVFNDGERYQLKIATVNEGTKYLGAKRLDKASRERLSVEIPFDIFRSTDDDKRRLGEKTNTNVDASDDDGSLKDVLAVLQEVRGIPISPDAGEFLLYLQRMNQCIKTPNKTKLEIENFSPEYCKGCHLMREKNNLCGSVYAPSPRLRIALQNLAKGFAFIRMEKQGVAEGRTELEDVVAAAPFVLYGKLDIHPGWIDKEAKGSKWQAVIHVIKYATTRFATAMSTNYEHLLQRSEESIKALDKYATEHDAWSYEL